MLPWLAPRLVLVVGLLLVSPAHAEGREHVVQSGQRLGAIARRYGVSVEALCEANALRRNERLHPGQHLVIPPSERRNAPEPPTERGRTVHASSSPFPTGGPSYKRYQKPAVKRGWVKLMGFHGVWEGQLTTRQGKLLPKGAAAASLVLGWPRHDLRIDARLLALLGKVSDAFGGRQLRIVSGYRTTSWVEESKHPQGRACDFSVIGVPNEVVRDYLRTLENVGVGYYPNSSFVHLDVREQAGYWIDYARPGEAPRSKPGARGGDTSSTATGEPGPSSQDAHAPTPEPEVREPEVATSVSGNPAPDAAADPAP